MIRRYLTAVTLIAVMFAASPLRGDDPPRGVSAILAENDRGLLRSLTTYITSNPKAADIEQAYATLFQRVIANDWFLDHEAIARRYLDENADGAVRPLAQIIATMARAQSGQYGEALASFKLLMQGLNDPSQEEFAVNFADALAAAATKAGDYAVTRQVYEVLIKQFGANPALGQRAGAELARLDLIGKAAPAFTAKDLDGKSLRSADLKGKYTLIDFWATWCGPCVTELPNIQSAYEKYHAKGFDVVAVSLDETPQPLVDFVKARKLPWRQVHNATSDADLVAAFRVGSIPASFLVGPDGTVIRLELRGDALEKALESLIK